MGDRRVKALRMAHWDSFAQEPLIKAKQLKAGDAILYFGHEVQVDKISVKGGMVVIVGRGPAATSGPDAGLSAGVDLSVDKHNLVRVVRFAGEKP